MASDADAAGNGTAFADEAPPGPSVRGFLHRPEGPARDAVVLTHGAGASAEAPLLVALAQAFVAAGLLVLRCDLPFRQASPKGPPTPGGAATDRAGLRRAGQIARRLAPGRLFLGGHSYGGRQASLLAAEEPAVADGLLLLGYPLRPPRWPGSGRTAHFPALSVPTFFVHGSRDPFGSVADLRAALALIRAPTALLPIEGAGHALAGPRRSPARAVAVEVVEAFLTFVGRS